MSTEMERDGQLWLFNQLYGFKSVPPDQDCETFVKAALICAKADGILAPDERDWVVGHAAALRNAGYELAKTYAADEDLLEVISNSSAIDKSGRRAIVYLAIQACSANGDYHPDKKAKVRKMADALGVEEEVVTQLEEICVREAGIREQRIKLFFPEGSPYSKTD